MWLNNYEELVAFFREEGHFRVPEDYLTVDGVNLASWKNGQRQRRKQGKLLEEEQRLLDKIGFPWDAYTENWDKRYAEAVAFVARHGSLQPKAGSRLANWLDRQRANLADGTLPESCRQQLTALDEHWQQRRP